MAIVTSPNRAYNGISAGVRFVNGQAECNDEWILGWFKKHCYEVVRGDKTVISGDGKGVGGDVEGSGNTADIGANGAETEPDKDNPDSSVGADGTPKKSVNEDEKLSDAVANEQATDETPKKAPVKSGRKRAETK